MLDPFGKKARKIIEDFGGIEAFLERIPGYIGIDEVLERVTWDGEPPEEVLNAEEWRDLMTFYALLGALALSPYGFEMELVRDKNAEIYLAKLRNAENLEETSLHVKRISEGEIPEKDRLILEKSRHKELSEEDRRKLRIEYKMWLSHFILLWEGSLKDVYIRNSWAYLRRGDLLNLWKKAFERNLERAVNMLYDVRDELPEFYSALREKLSEVAREKFKERIEAMGSVGAPQARPLSALRQEGP